jgi:hypothetical protein
MTYTIDWRRLLDLGWWHWAATVPLLTAYVALGAERGWPCFAAALLLCVGMTMLAQWQSPEPGSMAVQVRVGYAALLVLGLAPAAFWFHWVQIAGTTAMVTVGYCPLERLLSLMSWNRTRRLTWRMVRRTFLSRPTCGGLLRPVAPGGGPDPSVAACAHAPACGILLARPAAPHGAAGW